MLRSFPCIPTLMLFDESGRLPPATVVRSQGKGKECNMHQASGDRGSSGVAAIPNTGLAAAEATLQAAASAPAFAGLDVGKELARLAQRAADIRQ